MTRHLHLDLDRLYRNVLSLSARVEEMIEKASSALREGRLDLAEEVVDSDYLVDQTEVEIENECLKLLALHQPVAIDLRRIATVLKVNNDLERIADLACNIAERAQAIYDFVGFQVPKKLEQMAPLSNEMVHGSLDAFVQMDTDAARLVMARDNEVDRLNVEIINELQDFMRENPDLVPPALHCFSASRHFERIADHATNIAEDVIYLVEGSIVRHRHFESPRAV